MWSLALLGLVLAVFVALVVRGVRRRRAPRKNRVDQQPQAADDDSPTGYVPGVWLLGGADSAQAHGRDSNVHPGTGHDAGQGGGDSGAGDGGSGGSH